jgi:hypothetical protein
VTKEVKKMYGWETMNRWQDNKHSEEIYLMTAKVYSSSDRALCGASVSTVMNLLVT